MRSNSIGRTLALLGATLAAAAGAPAFGAHSRTQPFTSEEVPKRKPRVRYYQPPLEVERDRERALHNAAIEAKKAAKRARRGR